MSRKINPRSFFGRRIGDITVQGFKPDGRANDLTCFCHGCERNITVGAYALLYGGWNYNHCNECRIDEELTQEQIEECQAIYMFINCLVRRGLTVNKHSEIIRRGPENLP